MPRFVKGILWIFVSLAFLCFIAIASLPSLVSTRWGTKQTIEWFNYFASGTLSVDEVRLNWLGNQHLKNLHYEDEKGEKILSFELFETKTSLLYLLFGGRSFGPTELDTLYLVIEEKEKIPKEKKKKKNGRMRKGFEWLQFEEKLTLHDGTVIFKSPEMSPITLSNIQAEKQEGPPLYHISADTEQGDLTGSIDISFANREKRHIIGSVKNFPLAILDQLERSSLYTDALGNKLDLEIILTQDPDKTLTLSATVATKNMSGRVEGETRENTFYLHPSSHLNFTITPKLFNYLLPESQKEEWTLASNTEIAFETEKGEFPLNLKKPDFHDIVLQMKGKVERAEINHKTLGSYSLNNFTIEIIALNNLEIAYKGEIQGKEASQVNGEISITPDWDIYFTTDYKGFPVSLVRLISPSSEKSIRRLFDHSFDLISEGIYKDGKLAAQINVTAPGLLMKGEVEGTPNNLDFELSGSKTLPGKMGEYVGSLIEFQLKGVMNFSREGASIPLLNGEVTTPYYVITLKGTIGERGKSLDYNEVELVATGEIVDLPFGEEFPQVSLQNGGFFVNIDGPSNRIFGQAFVNTRVSTEEETIDSKALQTRFEINQYIREGELDFEKANYTFNCNLEGLPLVLLTPLMPGDLDLPSLFGTTATIQASGSYTPTQDPRGTIDLKAKGDGFDAVLSFSVDDTMSIAQSKTAYIHWELTPQRYHTLISTLRADKQPYFQLTRTAAIDLTIKELTCPTTHPQDVSHFLCESGVVADLKVGTLSFFSPQTKEYLIIEGTAGSMKAENFSQLIDLQFSGNVFAQNIPQSEQSSFEFKGMILDLWTPEGTFNREGLALDGELNLELLPVRQMTGIAPMDEETRQLVQAILGELVNARIYGKVSQLTGPLTIDVKASNFKATLPIMLHPHAIYLRDFVDAELTLTEAVNQTLLKDINPLLIVGAYSDHPIKIYLDPEGFMIPIRPYSLQGVQIAKATFDIGKIRVRNGGQIQLLMDFLKAKDVTPEGEMDAWFTPIYMSLQDGVATSQRFDALLANTVHIALWGSVNLITDQVRMTLGISAPTLQQRFNISGLSKTEMFQVKMRGTTNNLELDWSSASTRIGFIIARSAGGQLGIIVGGILEQIVTAFGEDPTPPPTTTPFPWEVHANPTTEEEG